MESISLHQPDAKGGSGQTPMLEYRKDMPEKNRYVVLTEAGRDHLEKLSL